MTWLRWLLAAFRFTPWPTPRPTPRPTPSPTPTPLVLEAAARELVAMHRDERTRLGLPAHQVHPWLSAAAQAHADHMAWVGVMAHEGIGDGTAWTRITRTGYSPSQFAENVAAGQTSAAACFASWLASPAHRPNVLGPELDIGVGTAIDADGIPYWCALYASPAAR